MIFALYAIDITTTKISFLEKFSQRPTSKFSFKVPLLNLVSIFTLKLHYKLHFELTQKLIEDCFFWW